MSTQLDNPNRKKPSAIQWLGTLLLVLGATLAGAFLTRQLKEAGSGHTYYEFIGGGVLLAVIGFAIVLNARRKFQ
jgi:membrane protein DedA with SNARE-associated domain